MSKQDIKDTVFSHAETDQSVINHKALQELFSIEKAKKAQKASEPTANIPMKTESPKTILGNDRAMNIDITMKGMLRLMGVGDIIDAIKTMNMNPKHNEHGETVKTLIGILPKPDEHEKMIKLSKAPDAKLLVADNCFVELCKIPDYARRLQVMDMFNGFEETVANLRLKTQCITDASLEMTESQPVHQLFALVLHMLNSMKQANKCLKGKQLAVVAGFRVENLKIIRDIKSYGNTDKPVTLLHYLIAIIQSKKDDTMLSLVTSLPNVEGASKLNIADLDIELKDLDKQLKNLDGAINFGEAETEKTLSVERLASLREYYNKAKVKLKSCATQLREAEKSFLSTAVYFGEKRDELTTQDEKQLLNPKSKSAQPGTFMKMISDFWTELDKTQRDLPRVKAAHVHHLAVDEVGIGTLRVCRW